MPGAQPGGRSRVRRAARWEQLVVVAVPLVLLVVVAAVGGVIVVVDVAGIDWCWRCCYCCNTRLLCNKMALIISGCG